MNSPETLFERELLLFVGKGGVGKTTTAAAAALHQARRGRRTLLVTVDPAQRLEDALGVPVGHRIRAVEGKLHALMLDPKKMIEEFLRETVPDRNLANHPFSKYLSNYMPGINELLGIGKLIEIRRERDFDTIVIDTAPTGHALSFLTTPLKVRDLLQESLVLKWAVRGHTLYRRLAKGGRALSGLWGGKALLPPLPDVDVEALLKRTSQRVGEIHRLLQDSARTSLFLVTNPERLPIEETVDLHRYLTQTLGIRVAALVVNKMTPDPLGPLEKAFDRLHGDSEAQRLLRQHLSGEGYPVALAQALLDATRFEQQRHQMNEAYLQSLSHLLPRVPLLRVPLFRSDVWGLDRLRELEAALVASAATPSPPVEARS